MFFKRCYKSANIFDETGTFDWMDLIWRRIGEKVSGCKLMRWDVLTVAGDDYGETKSRVAHLVPSLFFPLSLTV